MTDPLLLLVAFVLATIGVARAVRLLLHDAYPPAEALRRWWFNRTVAKGGWREGWAPLLTDDEGESGCPFCAAPYVAAIGMVCTQVAGIWTPDLGTLAGWWWTLAVWATVSYLAACFVVRDEPDPIEVD